MPLATIAPAVALTELPEIVELMILTGIASPGPCRSTGVVDVQPAASRGVAAGHIVDAVFRDLGTLDPQRLGGPVDPPAADKP